MAKEARNFKIKDNVNVTEEVVAIIAGLSATEVLGVDSLEGNLKNKTIEKSGFNKLSKGIRIKENDDDTISITLSINVDYGKEVESVCNDVREKVISTVFNMTGLTVKEVDIKVASVILENIE